MACCCNNPYFFGCANPCEGLTINYTAPADGTYSLIANYLGGMVKIDTDVLAGDVLFFDTSELNEFARYQFEVLLNGVILEFEDVDAMPYNCFDVQFKPFGAKAETVVLTLI